MLTRLFRPKWLGGLLLATVFAAACFALGQWQWSRYEAKTERNATLDRNYRADPVAFDEVVDDGGVRPGADWARVELRGTYEDDHIYVRNRPNEGVYGYEVLGLLREDSGRLIVVDRGWVRNSPESAAVLPEVPAPPQGEVTVLGWVRPYERSLGRDLPAGQVASIARPDLEGVVGEDLPGAYVRMQLETDAAGQEVDSGLRPLEPPDRSLGPHQAYAIQWWLTMALGYAFVILGVRRELREEQEPLGPGEPEPVRRPAKVSRWDEDDY
ncbi:SURF1 family protein [Nostocoides sp. F2B08]|uniref:SURF1 family cytochrome oxidase biogenesis protein n=1 Tax=Nostocoides sp. F2B08 TaxID=2653936 RepID=UPI001D046767|nr:SURF1 family protein [Tetrasphaera sp. F2B08]